MSPFCADYPLMIGNRDRDGHTIFVADNSGDMTLAGEVFGQIDAAGPKLDLRSIDELDLAVTAQCDDVLAARRDMPVGHAARRRATNFRPRTRRQLERVGAAGSERDFDFLSMGLSIRPG